MIFPLRYELDESDASENLVVLRERPHWVRGLLLAIAALVGFCYFLSLDPLVGKLKPIGSGLVASSACLVAGIFFLVESTLRLDVTHREVRIERRLGLRFQRTTYRFADIAHFFEVKSVNGSRLGVETATGKTHYITLSTEYVSLKEQTAMANRMIRHRRLD